MNIGFTKMHGLGNDFIVIDKNKVLLRRHYDKVVQRTGKHVFHGIIIANPVLA